MAAGDVDRRLNYFDGQFLQAKDFNDEQKYHMDRHRRANRSFHTPGVTDGLRVVGDIGDSTITVQSGTALDAQGWLIVLPEDYKLALPKPDSGNSKEWCVVISYSEKDADPAKGGGENTRWKEEPKIELIEPTKYENDEKNRGIKIKMGQVTVSGQGLVSKVNDDQQGAGVKVSDELQVTQLTLKAKAATPSSFPSMRSAAEGQVVELEGGLHVNGALQVRARLILEGKDPCKVGQPTRIKKPFTTIPKSGFPLLHVEATTSSPDAGFYWLVGRFKDTPAVFFYVTEAGGGLSSIDISYTVYELDIEVSKVK